ALALLAGPAVTRAGEIFSVSFSQEEYRLNQENGYTGISADEIFVVGKAGYPELPMVNRKYYIPADRTIVGINILNAVKDRIPGTFLQNKKGLKDGQPFQSYRLIKSRYTPGRLKQITLGSVIS
ncbi:MAG: hypothetical protein JSV44_02990, partial [Candidatus Zixiibacteriota bacterium]